MNFILRNIKRKNTLITYLKYFVRRTLHVGMHLVFRERIIGLDASGSFHMAIDCTSKNNSRQRIIGLLAASGSFDVIDFTPKNIVCLIFFNRLFQN